MKLIDNPKGNYKFLSGIAPYSCGVIAMPGYEIIRVKLQDPIAINEFVFEQISNFFDG